MQLTPDTIYHVGELLTLAGVAWRVVKAANRVADVLADFPPHKHVNGLILYPKGYEPTTVERLSDRAGTGLVGGNT